MNNKNNGLNFSDNKVKIIALSGLMAAIVAVATMFLKIPTAIGYFHMGDGFIFLSAALLGPYGALAGAIGSALADLASGYIVYIPVTLIIKGLMGLIAAYGIKNNQDILRCITVFALAEVLMVLGYFSFEAIMYGAATAAGVVMFNIMQGIVGVIIGTISIKFLGDKIKMFK